MSNNKNLVQQDALLHPNVSVYINIETAFATLSVVIPVMVLLFRDSGLSMTEVTGLQAAFAIFLAICQVPTGYFADKYGRKRAMQIGAAITFVAEIIYAFGNSFNSFLLGELLIALGLSFIGGADVALLSDTLKSINAQEAFSRIRGRAIARLQLVSALCAAASGYLTVAIGFKGVFLLAALGPFIMFCFASKLVEVRIPKTEKEAQLKTGFWRLVLQELWTNRYVRWLILLGACIQAFNQPSLWFYQQYFEAVDINIQTTGLLFAGFNLWAAAWTRYASRIEAFIGGERVLLLLVFIQSIAYLLLAGILAPWAASLFLCHQMVRSLHGITLSDLLNAELNSETKATVNSASSLVSLTLYMLVLLPMGKLADVYHIQTSFLFAGIGVLVMGIVVFSLKPTPVGQTVTT